MRRRGRCQRPGHWENELAAVRCERGAVDPRYILPRVSSNDLRIVRDDLMSPVPDRYDQDCGCQHHAARLAFDERRTIAVARAGDAVALSISRHGAILERCWPLADRYRGGDLTKPVALPAGMARATDRALDLWMSSRSFFRSPLVWTYKLL
jgi:hypothetical protein